MIRYSFEVKPFYKIDEKFKDKRGIVWRVIGQPFGDFSLSGYGSNMNDIRDYVQAYLNLDFENKLKDNPDSSNQVYTLKNDIGFTKAMTLSEIEKQFKQLKED